MLQMINVQLKRFHVCLLTRTESRWELGVCVPSPGPALARHPGSPLPAGLPAQARVPTGLGLFPRRNCSVPLLFLCPSQRPPMTKAGAVQGGVPVRRGRCRDDCPKASFWGETPGQEGEAGSAPWLGVCTQHCGPHRAVAACELTLGPRCGLQGAGREGRPRRSLLGQGKLQGCAFKKCET